MHHFNTTANHYTSPLVLHSCRTAVVIHSGSSSEWFVHPPPETDEAVLMPSECSVSGVSLTTGQRGGEDGSVEGARGGGGGKDEGQGGPGEGVGGGVGGTQKVGGGGSSQIPL